MWVTLNISAAMTCKTAESRNALFGATQKLHHSVNYRESARFECLVSMKSSQGMQDHSGAKSANWLANYLSELSTSFPISSDQTGWNPGTRLILPVTNGQMHTKENRVCMSNRSTSTSEGL